MQRIIALISGKRKQKIVFFLNKRFHLAILSPIFASFLCSCSSVPTATSPTLALAPAAPVSIQTQEQRLRTIDNWEIKGKIALITQKEGGSANVDWRKTAGSYRIAFTGPFGVSGFNLSGSPGNVTLIMAKGERFTANSPEELVQQHLGYRLPVSNLNYWIRGLPIPGVAYNGQRDSAQRLTSFTQKGWSVQYADYKRNGIVDLPQKINIQGPELKVKMVIYQWRIW